MAEYPTTIYTPRTMQNLPGLVRVNTDLKNLYAEDYNEAMAEIVAIETILGINPEGSHTTIKAFLEYLDSKPSGGGVWGGITGYISTQTDLQTALNTKQNILSVAVLGALIYSLNYKYPTEDNDKILISDSSDSNNAKNLYVSDLADFIKTNYVNPYYQALLSATNFGAFINDLSAKLGAVDADYFVARDSVGGLTKKISWAYFKSVLKTYFDTIYAPLGTAFRTQITGGGSIVSPAINTTYYWGQGGFQASTVASYMWYKWLGVASHIKAVHIKIIVLAPFPTTEGCSLSLKIGIYNYILSTGLNLSAGGIFNIDVSGQNYAIAQNDVIALLIETPAWSVRPGSLYFQHEILIEN